MGNICPCFSKNIKISNYQNTKIIPNPFCTLHIFIKIAVYLMENIFSQRLRDNIPLNLPNTINTIVIYKSL